MLLVCFCTSMDGEMSIVYYDILNTVGALFVVVLGGYDNEVDKSMQLRIIQN